MSQGGIEAVAVVLANNVPDVELGKAGRCGRQRLEVPSPTGYTVEQKAVAVACVGREMAADHRELDRVVVCVREGVRSVYENVCEGVIRGNLPTNHIACGAGRHTSPEDDAVG